jgi:hypothetical protein
VKFSFYIIIEILAFLIYLVNFEKVRKNTLRVFLPFLFVVLIYEAGTMLGCFTINGSNHFAANIFMLFQFSFYIILIRSIFSSMKIRKMVDVCQLTLCVVFFINFFFFQQWHTYNSYTYIFASIIIILWCCFLFRYLMIKTENISLIHFPFFWIYSGVLFFYLIRLFFMLYFTFFAYTFNEIYIKIFKSFSSISIFLLYSCIILSILFFKPPLKKI